MFSEKNCIKYVMYGNKYYIWIIYYIIHVDYRGNRGWGDGVGDKRQIFTFF